MDTLNKLTQLEVGKKYTIVGMSEFGFPYQFQIVLEEVRVEPYAQYKESYLLIFKQKKKILSRQIRFYGIKPVLVWDGWADPDTEMYPFKKTSDYGSSGVVVIRTGYPCFDDRYMQRARDSVKTAPIIEVYDKPVIQVTSQARPVAMVE